MNGAHVRRELLDVSLSTAITVSSVLVITVWHVVWPIVPKLPVLVLFSPVGAIAARLSMLRPMLF